MTAPSAEGHTERPETPAAPPDPVPEGEDTTANAVDQADDGGGRDGRYRRRLKEQAEAMTAVESERDQLRTRVEMLQRAEVTRLAHEDARLARPESIWAGDLQLADVLDDNGAVDVEKARAAITTVAAALGLARQPRQPKRDPSQGARPNDRVTDEGSWSELLRRK